MFVRRKTTNSDKIAVANILEKYTQHQRKKDSG